MQAAVCLLVGWLVGVEMTVEDDNGLYREQTQSHLESYSMALDAEQVHTKHTHTHTHTHTRGTTQRWHAHVKNSSVASLYLWLQQLVTDSKQREDQVTQARVTYVHQQEMDSMIDENDTLLVVSFELPVKVSKSEDGQFVVTPGKVSQ